MGRPKLSNDKTRMLLSFTEYDEDVYDYLKSLKNASAYVKHLVRANMQSGGQVVATSPTLATPTRIAPINRTVREVAVDRELQDRSKGYSKFQDSSGIGNVSAIGGLDL